MEKAMLETLPLGEILRKEEYLITLEGDLKRFYSLEEVKADYIQGQIFIQMSASIKHEEIFVELLTQLAFLAKSTKMGKVFGSRAAIAIDPDYHPEPDIFFVSKDNPGTYQANYFEGIPDLVIEIVSSSTRKLDLEQKRPLYQKYGVPEIYMIDFLKEKIYVDLKQEDQYQSQILGKTGLVQSQLIPDFQIKLSELL